MLVSVFSWGGEENKSLGLALSLLGLGGVEMGAQGTGGVCEILLECGGE